MVHETSRSRRRQANFDRILETAVGLVEEEGFDALTIHRLAKLTDYTPGALYRYFDGKDALVGSVLDVVIAGFAKVEEEALAAHPEATPLGRIAIVAFTYRRIAEQMPNRFALLARALAAKKNLLTTPEAAASSIAGAQRALAPMALAFGEAADQGDLSPGSAPPRAVALFSSLHGVLMLRKQARWAPDLIDLDALYVEVFRTLLHGWGADPAAIDSVLGELA